MKTRTLLQTSCIPTHYAVGRDHRIIDFFFILHCSSDQKLFRKMMPEQARLYDHREIRCGVNFLIRLCVVTNANYKHTH